MCPMFFEITTFLLLCLCCSLYWSTRQRLAKETQAAFNRGVKYGYEVATDMRRAKEAAMRKRAAARKHRDEN